MGMPISVEVVDEKVEQEHIEKAFDYFRYVDEKFSTYKETSEITQINKGQVRLEDASEDVRTVFRLCEETKQLTHGYFDIQRADGSYDPSGLVKGWAIYNAAHILGKYGYKNFFVEAGGDIESEGVNSEGESWRVGIRNPFNHEQIVKVLKITNRGVATSGTAARGQHVYNPHNRKEEITDIVSITVIGANIYEADRFATAAFAMGRGGIQFIENLEGFEAYMIDAKGVATMTSGFEQYV